jgi:hypothetical protein
MTRPSAVHVTQRSSRTHKTQRSAVHGIAHLSLALVVMLTVARLLRAATFSFVVVFVIIVVGLVTYRTFRTLSNAMF